MRPRTCLSSWYSRRISFVSPKRPLSSALKICASETLSKLIVEHPGMTVLPSFTTLRSVSLL